MLSLFGLDIAKIVNDAIKSGGGVRFGTLIHFTVGTRSPDNLSGGTNPITTTHIISGFVEQKEIKRSGQVGATVESVVSILGDSINPQVIPRVNDVVEMDGERYNLIELLARDPAAALYEFKAET